MVEIYNSISTNSREIKSALFQQPFKAHSFTSTLIFMKFWYKIVESLHDMDKWCSSKSFFFSKSIRHKWKLSHWTSSNNIRFSLNGLIHISNKKTIPVNLSIMQTQALQIYNLLQFDQYILFRYIKLRNSKNILLYQTFDNVNFLKTYQETRFVSRCKSKNHLCYIYLNQDFLGSCSYRFSWWLVI